MNIHVTSWHYRWLRFWGIILPPKIHVWWLNLEHFGDAWELDRYGEWQKKEQWEPTSLCLYVNSLWIYPFVIISILVYGFIVLGLSMIGFAVLVWPIRRALRKIRRTPKVKQPKEPRPPSITWAYIKARKRSVCPVLTYERE